MPKFAGLDYEVKSNFPVPLLKNIDLGFSEVASCLVSHTYGASEVRRQAVLDALSPFQILSKLWLTSLLKLYVRDYNNVVIVGSWFGQLAPMIHQVSEGKKFYLLVDIDPTACYVANDLTEKLGLNARVLSADVFDIYLSDHLANLKTLVVWSGVEHFHKAKATSWIQAQSSKLPISWVLQGTDMAGDDHISPVYSPEDLEHYFYDGSPVFQGELKTSLGSRFMTLHHC